MKILYLAAVPLFIIFSFISPCNGQSGYSVTVTINGAPDANIRLGYHVGHLQYIRDSLTTDKKGMCRFAGDEKLSPGVYMIVLPGNTFFEFLIDKDQYFDITCNINDLTGTLVFRGSEENERFLEYQRQWKIMQEKAMEISGRIKSAPSDSDAASDAKKQLADQEKKMKLFLNETAIANKGTLLGAIAKSIIPVESTMPAEYTGTASRDSVTRMRSYLYYKNHFFDNIDFTEPGLIRSPVLEGKLDQFFRQVIVQMPDSINRETDRVLKMSSVNKDMFQYVAVWLMNHYATSDIMGQDAVVVHLADSIYLSGKAPWASEEYINDLRKKVDRLRPNLIGQKAPELVMSSFAGYYVSLYDIKADYTIIYFWEPDCGHCKEATPLLKEYYDKNRLNGIEVFAVCTGHNREKWEQYIVTNGLSWTNGWDPERLSRFDILYDVVSTPMVYILDKDKTIIAKRLAVEDIPKYIETYRKYKAQ